jgi:hypothetical protein
MPDTKLHVYATECDWFVAESIEEAVEIGCKYAKDNFGDTEGYEDPEDYEQIFDDKLMTIILEDQEPYEKYQRTCGMWAATMGKGFLCGEHY